MTISDRPTLFLPFSGVFNSIKRLSVSTSLTNVYVTADIVFPFAEINTSGIPLVCVNTLTCPLAFVHLRITVTGNTDIESV